MSSPWILIAGILILAGLAAFVYWAGRKEKKNGFDWKSYPGFRFPPSVEESEKWFQTEPKTDKISLLGMLVWSCVLLAAALELCVMNTFLDIAALRLPMICLPGLLLLLQEGEILSAFLQIKRGKSRGIFSALNWVKWILLILWLLGFFVSLLVRGFQL